MKARALTIVVEALHFIVIWSLIVLLDECVTTLIAGPQPVIFSVYVGGCGPLALLLWLVQLATHVPAARTPRG